MLIDRRIALHKIEIGTKVHHLRFICLRVILYRYRFRKPPVDLSGICHPGGSELHFSVIPVVYKSKMNDAKHRNRTPHLHRSAAKFCGSDLHASDDRNVLRQGNRHSHHHFKKILCPDHIEAAFEQLHKVYTALQGNLHVGVPGHADASAIQKSRISDKFQAHIRQGYRDCPQGQFQICRTCHDLENVKLYIQQ